MAAALAGLWMLLFVVLRCLEHKEPWRFFWGGGSFARIAENIAAHGLYSVDGVNPTGFRPPLQPFLLAAARIVGRSHFVAAALTIHVLMYMATAAILFGTIRRTDRRPTIAWVALALFLLNVELMLQVLSCGETALYLVLMALLLNLLARWLQDTFSRSRAMLVGVCLGALFLAKPTALALLPVVLSYVVFSIPERRTAIARAVAIGATFLLMVGPWFAWLHFGVGSRSFGGTNEGVVLWQGNNQHFFELFPYVHLDRALSEGFLDRVYADRGAVSEVSKDEAATAEAMGYMRRDPSAALKRAAAKFVFTLAPLRFCVADAVWNAQTGEFEVDWARFSWTNYLMISTPYSVGLVVTLILAGAPRRWRPWDIFLVAAVLIQAAVLSVTFVFPRLCAPLQYATYCLVARRRRAEAEEESPG